MDEEKVDHRIILPGKYVSVDDEDFEDSFKLTENELNQINQFVEECKKLKKKRNNFLIVAGR